ncbi:MAG: amino acid-binding protein [Anaerolineaceae bacterium]|nr:amino acid-binding protein [Anaerolineaceae bacterium]
MKSKLSVLEGSFTIHRFPPNYEIPIRLFEGLFCNITRSEDEVSVICSSAVELDSLSADPGWSCIKVIGPLDLTLTGLLADILNVLAKVEISIISISTFDTDYIFVKSTKIHAAIDALLQAEYIFKQ